MELNREQIIKALECCTKPEVGACGKCPIYPFSLNMTETECMETAIRNALAIIKELSEENERLRIALNTDISIVRLSRGDGKTQYLREVARVKIDAVRSDTVRKMQDSIAVHFGTYTTEDTVKVLDVIRVIYKLGEELLNEGEEAKDDTVDRR